MSKKLCFLTMLIVTICVAFTSTAMAETGTPIPGTITATSSAFETGMATKDITVKTWVGVQEHIRIQKVPQSECQKFARFLNSDYLLGQTSNVPQMYEDHNGYLCRDKYSPTGWVKRGGGHTGADCGNIASPYTEKPRYKVVPPPSVELKHNTALIVTVNVTVNAKANVQLYCGTASGNGSATDNVQVNYLSYIHATGAAKLKLFLSVAIKAADEAKSHAEVSCSYTPSSPPPPPSQPVCTDHNATNYGSPPPCQYPPPPPVCEDKTATNYGGPLPCQYPPPPPVCEDKTATNYGGPLPCQYPTQSIVITSMTNLNFIPTGKSSGPFYVAVHASNAGGSLTIDPGIGAVSTCESTIPQGNVTFSSLPAGNSTECVIVYAPEDSDKPTSMTVTATATLGSAFDIASEEFEIQYPTRPS